MKTLFSIMEFLSGFNMTRSGLGEHGDHFQMAWYGGKAISRSVFRTGYTQAILHSIKLRTGYSRPGLWMQKKIMPYLKVIRFATWQALKMQLRRGVHSN